jgi:hypothetical protein
MKARHVKAVLGATALAGAAFYGPAAHAQILTYMNFDQGIVAQSPGPPYVASTKTVASSTVPIQQTVTANDGYGATITANYNVSDNGAIAVISVNCSGSMSALYSNAIQEMDMGLHGTTFNLSQPCSYTASITESGPGQAGVEISGTGVFFDPPSDTNASSYYAGRIGAGTVDFGEGWVISDEGDVAPVAQSGSDSITVTFIATEPVPEPSSVSLLGIGSVALLARRRRVGRASLTAPELGGTNR